MMMSHWKGVGTGYSEVTDLKQLRCQCVEPFLASPSGNYLCEQDNAFRTISFGGNDTELENWFLLDLVMCRTSN